MNLWQFLLLVSIIVSDVTSKILVLTYVKSPVLFQHFILIYPLINKGIALSSFYNFGQHYQYIICLLMVLVLAVVFWHLLRRMKQSLNIFPEILVLAGGIGNLISRLIYGGVVDFLAFYIKGFRSSVFNLADISISLGLFLIIVRTIDES